MKVTVKEGGRSEQFETAEMAARVKEHFPIGDRVPGIEGKAFDFLSWYRVWAGDGAPHDEPTHVRAEGADEFGATIPWFEMEQAAFLYEQNGQPLAKGPIRLYVPGGSSECLNVKGVVSVEFLHDPELGGKAEFGFRNVITPGELSKTNR